MCYTVDKFGCNLLNRRPSQNWKPPSRTGKEVRQFLGLASYYRNYLPQFATDCISIDWPYAKKVYHSMELGNTTCLFYYKEGIVSGDWQTCLGYYSTNQTNDRRKWHRSWCSFGAVTWSWMENSCSVEQNAQHMPEKLQHSRQRMAGYSWSYYSSLETLANRNCIWSTYWPCSFTTNFEQRRRKT